MLSVVIPAYNESEVIANTIDKIKSVLSGSGISCEIIVVDDGSTDETFEIVSRISAVDVSVRGVGFTRNFGKDNAIISGLSEARGDCAVVIDADLQHPPEKIIDMYHIWENGFEIIEGKKRKSDKRIIYSVLSSFFYSAISRAIKIDMRGTSDFKLLDKKVVITLLNMQERNAFFRALPSWTGYRTAEVIYDVQERVAGNTKWSVWKLIRYAFTNIASFSSSPMQIVTVLGGLGLVGSFITSLIAFIQKIKGESVEGFTTVIIMEGFMGSIIMISLGIIGYYLSKIYDEVKGRPQYIIARRTDEIKEKVTKKD